MTRPARSWDFDGRETITVRELPSGSRIVASSLGWIVRVDDHSHKRPGDMRIIAWARGILRNRLDGKNLLHPAGRVIRYFAKKDMV